MSESPRGTSWLGRGAVIASESFLLGVASVCSVPTLPDCEMAGLSAQDEVGPPELKSIHVRMLWDEASRVRGAKQYRQIHTIRFNGVKSRESVPSASR